jgi:hypothetical protein
MRACLEITAGDFAFATGHRRIALSRSPAPYIPPRPSRSQGPRQGGLNGANPDGSIGVGMLNRLDRGGDISATAACATRVPLLIPIATSPLVSGRRISLLPSPSKSPVSTRGRQEPRPRRRTECAVHQPDRHIAVGILR